MANLGDVDSDKPTTFEEELIIIEKDHGEIFAITWKLNF